MTGAVAALRPAGRSPERAWIRRRRTRMSPPDMACPPPSCEGSNVARTCHGPIPTFPDARQSVRRPVSSPGARGGAGLRGHALREKRRVPVSVHPRETGKASPANSPVGDTARWPGSERKAAGTCVPAASICHRSKGRACGPLRGSSCPGRTGPGSDRRSRRLSPSRRPEPPSPRHAKRWPSGRDRPSRAAPGHP